MKKKMFNLWYNEYGRELAKNALPIDDVEEKEIRRKAKEIFSYTYNLFAEFMCERLIPMDNHIRCHLRSIDDLYEEYYARKLMAEYTRDDIIPYMTDLYDSYYKEKSIKKEHFDSLRKHFGELLSSAKEEIKNCDNMLIMLKREKKDVESLLVTE